MTFFTRPSRIRSLTDVLAMMRRIYGVAIHAKKAHTARSSAAALYRRRWLRVVDSAPACEKSEEPVPITPFISFRVTPSNLKRVTTCQLRLKPLVAGSACLSAHDPATEMIGQDYRQTRPTRAAKSRPRMFQSQCAPFPWCLLRSAQYRQNESQALTVLQKLPFTQPAMSEHVGSP
jgi:hypothetical protein